jgi:hypothetical protein
MERNKLEELVGSGMSTYEIAKHMTTSQTNVRYWLRKYGLNTRYIQEKNGFRNGKKCVCCSNDLLGHQRMFCSSKCNVKHHYSNNIKENPNTNSRQKEVSIKRKMILINMKGGKCQLCGYNKNMAGLTFHHRDPENKTFGLNTRMLSNTKFESILSEAEKCDLLCHNCHMETHYPDLAMS